MPVFFNSVFLFFLFFCIFLSQTVDEPGISFKTKHRDFRLTETESLYLLKEKGKFCYLILQPARRIQYAGEDPHA